MLAQRVISAVVLAPLLLLIVAVGGQWYVLLVLVAALLAGTELYRLMRRASYAPLWPVGLVVIAAFILDPYLLPGGISWPVLSFAVLLSFAYLVLRQELSAGLVGWALTWVPPLYVGVLAATFVSLRMLPQGDRWVYLVLGVTWMTDIGAYFVGRFMGRRPFFPKISPRKTLEGAVGGTITGILAGVLLAVLFGWDPRLIAGLALISAVVAEVGDLAESLLKRQLRAKDSSNLIPGHGGVLDRMDSLLFVGAVTYYWAIWIGSSL